MLYTPFTFPIVIDEIKSLLHLVLGERSVTIAIQRNHIVKKQSMMEIPSIAMKENLNLEIVRENLIAKFMIIHQKETGVVAAVGIKNGGMMKEEIRGNTVNHQDITEMINIQKIILYIVEIPADTNRVGGILMTQRLSASVIDPKHQTMNVNHVTLIENVMKG